MSEVSVEDNPLSESYGRDPIRGAEPALKLPVRNVSVEDRSLSESVGVSSVALGPHLDSLLVSTRESLFGR